TLIGFATYCRTGRLRWLVGSLSCFALALLAREAALCLLLLLPLVAATLRDRDVVAPNRRAMHLLAYAGVAAVYLVVGRAVIVAPPLIGPPGDTAIGFRLLTMLDVLVRYVEVLIVPLDLHMERLVPPATSAIDPGALVGLAVLTAFVLIAIRL